MYVLGVWSMIDLFQPDLKTVRYLDYDSDQAYFAGPSDATHAMPAMLLWHAIAAQTRPNPGALCALQTLHEIWLDSDPFLAGRIQYGPVRAVNTLFSLKRTYVR